MSVIVKSNNSQITLRADTQISVSGKVPTNSLEIQGGNITNIINDKFINLTDTPSTYTGQSKKLVQVASTEDKIEFTSEPTADVVQLNVLYTPDGNEPVGSIYWHEVDGTFNLVLKNGSILQSGQELHFYGKASGNILNGEVCQFAGVQGDHILIKKAVASEINTNPEYLVGVATQNISNGSFGYVTWFGKINGVYTKTPNNNDAQDWVAGDILYFNFSTGQLTKTQPQAPTRSIIVASVVKVQSGGSENGIILVRPTFGTKLTDLDDVDGTPLTTTGQLLVWDNTRQVFDFTENITNYQKILRTITNKTTSYTLLATDDFVIFNGTSLTATLPTVVGNSGKSFEIKNINISQLTINTTSSQTIDGDLTLNLLQYEVLKIISNGSNWLII